MCSPCATAGTLGGGTVQVPAGTYLVRLRVQVRTGFIDSLPITVTGSPGKLDVDANQQVKVV